MKQIKGIIIIVGLVLILLLSFGLRVALYDAAMANLANKRVNEELQTTITKLSAEIESLKSNPVTITKEVIKTETKVITEVITKVVTAACQQDRARQNTLMLSMGQGSDGFRIGKATVAEQIRPVIGVDYLRKIQDNASIGVGVLSNKTVVIKYGRDF
jgi:hypothetical protein